MSSWLSTFIVAIILIHSCNAQLSIDDLISRALSLVRPIFDTSQPLQNDDMLRKEPEPSPDDLRDSSILGARQHSYLDDLPLCKGSNRICQFISCSAENFKKDPTFANIQLGVQILGDKKLRTAISSNPETIDAVCKEQGMDAAQCKVFSKGFQLIDKFITTIEKKPDDKEKPNFAQQPQSDPIPVPINNDVQNDDFADYDLSPPSPPQSPGQKALGSKTWSSRPQQNSPQLLDVRNDLVASLTPPPLWAPPTLAPFTPPTTPTAPPLAFPTVPSLILPSFKLPFLEKYFSTEKFVFGPPIKNNQLVRVKRFVIYEMPTLTGQNEHIRAKREDYYDDLSAKPSEKTDDSVQATDSEDYYGNLEDTVPEPIAQSPLRNCVNILGI